MVCILHIDFISLAVLNISTSAQLAFQMGENFTPPSLDVTSPIEYFPYFEGRYLAVAASLTGGNVLAQFVKMLQQWTHELGKLDEINTWSFGKYAYNGACIVGVRLQKYCNESNDSNLIQTFKYIDNLINLQSRITQHCIKNAGSANY